MHTPSEVASTAHQKGDFSLLMSVYQGEQAQYLDECLQSVCRSTLIPAEVVLVEDGPLNEALEQVIDRFRAQLAIVSVRLERNSGLAQALNEGLRQCRHRLVARLDTDDLALEGRFQTQCRFLAAHPSIVAVGSYVEDFDAATGRPLGLRATPHGDEEIRCFAKLRNPMNHPSVMYRRDAILSVGGYPELPWFEDYALWGACLARNLQLANIGEVLTRMRAGRGQVGRRHGLRYLFAELRFALRMRSIGLFSLLEELRFIALRLPLRVLPLSSLARVYRVFLRSPSKSH